jgi:LysM repeat protein
MGRATAAAVGILLLSVTGSASAQSLSGSRATMREQNAIARQHDFSFLRTSTQVRKFVDLGLLAWLPGNGDYELANVSFPYARPAVKTFIERLASQYRSACGEALTVTSLTRPESRQPRNASELSVHPAGMAVDLRISRRGDCRRWLEATLLSLEGTGVIDATRERYPAHYHVAVYPDPYLHYVNRLVERGSRLASSGGRTAPVTASLNPATASGPSEPSEPVAEGTSYTVRRGDSLWSIARRHGLTVDALKAANGLSTSRIKAGETITLPAR